MTEAGFVHKNTAYGVFFEALWARYKHLYLEELIQEEMVKSSKQCAVPRYNMSEQERGKFQEMADWSHAQPADFNLKRGEFTVLNLWFQEGLDSGAGGPGAVAVLPGLEGGAGPAPRHQGAA